MKIVYFREVGQMLTKKTKYIQYLLWNMMVFYDKM